MSCPKCHGNRRWPLYLALIACAVLATLAVAAEPRLDLETAARLTVQRQPLLTAQEAAIAALREEAVAASQLPDPRLVVGVEGLPTDSFSLTREAMTQTVVGLSQLIPGGDKRALASRRLEHAASREAIALDIERRRVARAAGLAWLEAYAAEQTRTLTRDLEAEYSRQIEWNQVAYKTGQLGQDETLAQRTQLEAVRSRLAQLDGTIARARAGLTRWLGEAGRLPLAPLNPPAAPPDAGTLATRLDEHPEMRAAQAGLAAGQIEGKIAREAYKPDWSIDLTYGIRGEGRADTLKLMVGVDLPLFPDKRQDRMLAARLAEVDRMAAVLEDRRRELAADLAAAWADWQSADMRLNRLTTDILPLAERRIDSALAAYQTGKAGYDRVLEARRAGLETRLEQLDLEVARAKAAVMLQYYQ